MSCSLAVV